MFNSPANIRKFRRGRRDKSCSKDLYFLYRKRLHNGIELRQDLYPSMRKLSYLLPSDNLSHSGFFSTNLFFRRKRPINIAGALLETLDSIT